MRAAAATPMNTSCRRRNAHRLTNEPGHGWQVSLSKRLSQSTGCAERMLDLVATATRERQRQGARRAGGVRASRWLNVAAGRVGVRSVAELAAELTARVGVIDAAR